LVLEIFYLGITTGTTPATFDPAGNVSRLQMAAFLSRSVDTTLRRSSRRAALRQFWTTQGAVNLGITTVGSGPAFLESDGGDIWVSNQTSGTVSRVRGTDGRVLETWTGAIFPSGIRPAMGKIFVTAHNNPGKLYRIDPSQAAGAMTTVASNLGDVPDGITFDGGRLWTANQGGGGGSVSIVTPGATIPWTVTTVTAGFVTPTGILYDGSNVWVADPGANNFLLKLNAGGAVLQTVTVGLSPQYPVFDGTNIWTANFGDNSVSVVRPSSGSVLATLTANGLFEPNAAAFDGQRIFVNGFGSVALWKAADLSLIGVFSTSVIQFSVPCSDGVNFWFASGPSQIARY
jgi:hypothetical protein